MQTTTNFSEKQQKKNMIQDQKSASEQPVNEELTAQAKETQQLEPTATELTQQQVAPKPADEATETQIPAATQIGETQQDIDEIDAVLSDYLASANFVAGNSANAVRQLNAVVAVVNHEKGKRSKVQNEVLQKLVVQVGDFVNATVKNKQVILLKSPNGVGIQIKKGGYLYNSELVEAITKEFAFDFSNQSTHHLLNITYKKWNNQVIAIITE